MSLTAVFWRVIGAVLFSISWILTFFGRGVDWLLRATDGIVLWLLKHAQAARRRAAQ